MERRKRYSNQFKRKIIHQYMKGETVADLNEKYSISKVSIYKWLDSISLNDEGEMEKIKKENRELKKQNITLAKTIHQLLQG